MAIAEEPGAQQHAAAGEESHVQRSHREEERQRLRDRMRAGKRRVRLEQMTDRILIAWHRDGCNPNDRDTAERLAYVAASALVAYRAEEETTPSMEDTLPFE